MTNADQSYFAGGWPEAKQYRKSVRREFSLLVAGMMMLSMIVFGYVMTDRYVSTVSFHVTKSLLVQARSFTATAGHHIMAAGGSDKLMLGNICNTLKSDDADIYWAGIVGPDDVFLAHTDLTEVIGGRSLEALADSQPSELLQPGERMSRRGDTLYIRIPIEEEDVLLGHLGVASSTRAIREARDLSILTVVSVTGLMMLLAIPFTVLRLRAKLRPLADMAQSLRQIDVDRLQVHIPYQGPNEIGYLAETLRVMGTKLSLAQQELLEQERLAQELRIAHEIQESLLPREYPASDRFGFAGMYRSAREVGGDYYDFVDLDDRHLAFIIADVSGKSLPGMLVMLLTRDIVKRLIHTARDPAHVLSMANRELFESIREGMFVTMLFGVLDKQTGHCVFASAGHNSIVRLQTATGQAELIKTKGFPLGLVGAETFEQRIEGGELTLGGGDWLVLYTDGISEAQNAEGSQFGIDRLMRLVEEHRREAPQQFIEGVVRQHDQFVRDTPQYDDITLVALRWSESPANQAPRQAHEASGDRR